MAMYNYNEALICITPPKKKGARGDSLRSLSKYADGLDCLTENNENGSPNVPSFPSLTPTGTGTPFNMLGMSDAQLRASSFMDIEKDFNEQNVMDIEDVNEQNVKERNYFSRLASPVTLFDSESFKELNAPMSPQHMKRGRKMKKSKTTSATSAIGTTTTPTLARGACN